MPIRAKRSVSFPPAVARRIEEEAARDGKTFSGWLTEAAERQLKLDAGRRALADWERENGPLTAEERAEARGKIDAAFGRSARRGRRSA